jgi:probable rRNA maturation factor
MPLTVSVTDGLGRPRRAHGLDAWLARAVPLRASGIVTIALVGDGAIRRLNRQFRGVDRATDVLSFPGDGPQAPGRRPRRRVALPGPEAGGPGPVLGDIAIATGVARRQARRQRHSLQTELRVLALHGVLHLLGYDHEADRGRMQRVEERLRRRAGLPSGLIARAPTGVGR